MIVKGIRAAFVVSLVVSVLLLPINVTLLVLGSNIATIIGILGVLENLVSIGILVGILVWALSR